MKAPQLNSTMKNATPAVVTDKFVAGRQAESAASESQRSKMTELKRKFLNNEKEKREKGLARGKTVDESRSTEQVKIQWRTGKGAALRKLASARKDVEVRGNERASEVVLRTRENMWFEVSRAKEAMEEYKAMRQKGGPADNKMNKMACVRTRSTKESFDMMQWACHMPGCGYVTDRSSQEKNRMPNGLIQ